MTGLWQVSGRSDLDWEETVRLDLYYVENWSVALDAMILWKTAFAVVKGQARTEMRRRGPGRVRAARGSGAAVVAARMAADLLLIVNDPAPGPYADLPEAWQMHRNNRPQGFAANVNSALDVVWANEGPAAVVCLNFDLEMDPERLSGWSWRSSLTTGPWRERFSPAAGRPAFSVGAPPTREGIDPRRGTTARSPAAGRPSVLRGCRHGRGGTLCRGGSRRASRGVPALDVRRHAPRGLGGRGPAR